MESNDNAVNSPQGAAPVSDTNTSSNLEEPEWPISPTFLSLRKGIIKKGETEEEITEENANYISDGIFYIDYLRGFLADLSHDKNVQNALSLFQFVPENFLPYDPNAENPKEITKDPRKATVILNEPLDKKNKEILDRQGKKIIRIDSGTYVNNGRLCDAFRKCNDSENTNFCFRQDSTVGIFADEELNQHESTSKEYRDRLDKIIAEYNLERDEKTAIKLDEVESEKGNRFYIHYTCPISLFEEHIFPIYSQRRTIACLMLGQMARDNFISYLVDPRRHNFLFRPSINAVYPFSKHWRDMKRKDSKCTEYLSEIEKLDIDKWNEKANAVVYRIEIFEKRLEERIEHRNRKYVNDAFEEIEKTFRYCVKNINIKEEDVFSQFTNVLNTAFEAIRTKFDDSEDGFIRMFALPISIEHDELIPIGWAGSDFEMREKAKFALNKLKGIEGTLNIKDKKERINEQRHIILDAASKEISDVFDAEKDFFLPGWLAGNEVVFIVWKRHSTKLRKNTDKKIFKIYRNALKNFYSLAQECYSFIRGARMELLLETTIQETAHESAHFILPAINVVKNHLSPLPQQMVLPAYAKEYAKEIDAYERYKDEVLESLSQLRAINSGASLIFASELKIKKEKVEVFYLLYKLKKLLDNRAKDSHKLISYSQSYDYVEADIDVAYFNHALYNLLDNAIKYGYDGSKIHINMDADKQKNTLTIRVISYGIGIPKNEKNRVYKLFERGLNASKISRGTGLGMYIVEKVCKSHGGTISHTSEELSKYNIPVLFNYKYNNTLTKNSSKDDKSVYNEELKSLQGSIEKEVVNDSSFVEYANVFSTRINMPTYRNTFIITIPLRQS